VKKGCPCTTLKWQLMENSNFHEHVNLMVFRIVGGFVLCVLCLEDYIQGGRRRRAL